MLGFLLKIAFKALYYKVFKKRGSKRMSDSGLIGTALAVVGGMPLVLAEAAAAQTPTAPNGVVIPVWALSLAVTLALGFIGYLLKRSMEQLDGPLEKLNTKVEDLAVKVAPLEARIQNVEKKLDSK